MATPIVRWVCDQFSRFDIDISEENARYILSMEDGHDLEEYMYELLDKNDPKCKKFVNELLGRWKPIVSVPENMTVYRKSDEVQDQVSGVKKKKGNSPKKKLIDSTPTSDNRIKDSLPAVNGFLELSSELQGLHIDSVTEEKSPDNQKKKQKFIPLYSQEGKARTTIQLPGRHACECQASKHNLINNCLGCGRVVCEQEGPGPCLFCGKLVCTKEQQEILSRGSKKSEKLRQYLMGGDNREYLPSTEAKMMNGFEKALQHKDKLLEYDRTSASRTQVIDDESDYFATESNKWLSKSDRELLQKREEEIRSKRFGSRKDRKVTLDFAGRRVFDADEERLGYDRNDDVIQQVHFGARPKQSSLKIASETGQIVNPSITQEAPKFIPQSNSPSTLNFSRALGSLESTNQEKRSSVRLQDKELQEMSDKGMCMSMHQPWASLLVKGIKKHEGRTWYTAHRGRLWIAATAKTPDSQDIGEVEQFYKEYYNDNYLAFPSEYPVSCLLGCVDVMDCSSQEEYRATHPEGESASPYVFICDHPQELIIKFPIKGKHKLYKLDSHIHQGAKKGLREPL